MIDAGATAIFCCSDEMAMGVLSALQGAGLACPSDVSVVGFDDLRFARYLQTPLTTIRQPARDIGGNAVRLIASIIRGEAGTWPDQVLQHELIVRASTAPPPESAR